MCFGGDPALPYGEPIGPPTVGKTAELWMANQVMTERQMRRTRTAIARPSSSSPIDDEDDTEIKNQLGG